MGFSRLGGRQPEFMVAIGFSEDLVFNPGLGMEQSRRDIRALDIDHKSNLSL